MGSYKPEPIDNPNWNEEQQQAVDIARTADDLVSLYGALNSGDAKDVADATIDSFANIMPQLFGPNSDATKDLVNGAIGNISDKRDAERQTLIDVGIINSDVNRFWELAQNWVRPHDPLVLDLDGDGVETFGITANRQVLFDHNGDGIKTATGWVSSDDGELYSLSEAA